MFIPLIKSKFKLPKISKSYVARYRLLEKLELGLSDEKKLTIVTGNPGYGKTSLVSDYIEKSKLNFLWYTLNESDNDLVIFISHFINGLQLVIDGITDNTKLLLEAADKSEVLNNIAGSIVDEISSNYERDFIIVIDDYHHLRDSEKINKFLEFFIEYLPENIQLILISRTLPNFRKLPQMRVRQQVSEISAIDLKLSKEEFEEILPETLRNGLTKEEKEKLYNKTEGWSGVLVLITQTYSTADQIRKKILNVSDSMETVNEYIAQEIFDIQDEKTKEFMLLSSPLPYLNKDICHNVGLTFINEMLEYLKNSNFITSDNDEEYKYNSVLKDFLYDRAEETLEPKKLNEIYSGIASTLISKKEIEQALDYFFIGQNYNEAEELLTDIAQELLNTNRTETLYKNLMRFPEEHAKNSCNIQIYLGEVNRLWGKYSEASECFYKAEELAIRQKSKSLLGRVYIYESIMRASKGEDSGNLIDESLNLLPEDDNYGLAFAYNTKGITYLFGEKVEESLDYFNKALKYYEKINDTFGQVKVLHNMGFAHSMLGSFEHSRETYEMSIKQAESSNKVPYIMTYNNIAIIYNYLGNFNEAHKFAEKALEISQKLKYKRDMSYAYWTLGMISTNLEDFLKAENYFNESLSIGLELGDRQVQAYALSGLSEISRLQEKLSKADDLINEAIRRRDLQIDNQGNIELLMQRVSIKSALKEFDNAKEDLEKYLLPKVEKLKYKYYLTHIYFFLSIVYENKDKKLFEFYTNKVSKLIKDNNYWFFLKQQSYIPELLDKKLDNKNETKIEIIKPSKIKFYCFGEFKTYIEDKLISNKEWNGFKTKLSLAYLLHNTKGVTKEQLANLLYPETEVTRTAINVILSRLRKAIEKEGDSTSYISFNEGKYIFNFGSSYWLDTEEFNYLFKSCTESNSEEEKLNLSEKIIEIYQGEFLSEFTSELWVQIEKESYKRKAEKTFELLFEIYSKKGDFNKILELSEKELSYDMCNEKAFIRKIKALISLDKKEDGLKQYKIMKNILKSQLGVEPGNESLILYQKLKNI